MSSHAQELMISTKVHAMFGYALMLAGLARIIEVCFIVPRFTPIEVDDGGSEHTLAGEVQSPGRAFRHLPAFVRGVVFVSVFIRTDVFSICF
jgi:hypothetical protein